MAITGGVERSAVSEGRETEESFRFPVSSPVAHVGANPTAFHASLDAWRVKKLSDSRRSPWTNEATVRQTKQKKMAVGSALRFLSSLTSDSFFQQVYLLPRGSKVTEAIRHAAGRPAHAHLHTSAAAAG